MGEYISAPITSKESLDGENARVIWFALFLAQICGVFNARMEKKYGRRAFMYGKIWR